MKSERFETWEYKHGIKIGPDGQEKEYGPLDIHVDITCQEFYLEERYQTEMYGPKGEVHPYADARGMAPKVEEIVFEIKGKRVEWIPTIEETVLARIESEKKKKKSNQSPNLSSSFTAQDAVIRILHALSHWDESLVVTDPSAFSSEGSRAAPSAKQPAASTSTSKSKPQTTAPGTTADMYVAGDLTWDHPSLASDAKDTRVKESTGTVRFFRAGVLHREDGPAVVTDSWASHYLFGKYFSKKDFDKVIKRIDVIRTGKMSPPTNGGWKTHTTKNGIDEYKAGGELHRENGPAFIDKQLKIEDYYLNGKKYKKDVYWKVIEEMTRRKAIARMVNDIRSVGTNKSTTTNSFSGQNNKGKGTTTTTTSSGTSSKGMSRHGKPVVWITPLAWQKMSYWAYLGGKQGQEITSFGRTVRDKRGRIRILDAYLIEQEGTAGSVDGDDSSINKLMVEMFKEHGIDPAEALGTWMHSHPGTGSSATYLSSTDEANIERILGEEYLVSVVLDQVGESPYCRVDVKNPRLSFECDLKVEVPGRTHRWSELAGDEALDQLADLSDLKAEFKEKVKSGYSSMMGYGGYTSYRSGGGLRYDEAEYDMSSGRPWISGSKGVYPDRGGWSGEDEEELWNKYLDRMYDEDDDVPNTQGTALNGEGWLDPGDLVQPFLIAGDDGWLDEEVGFTQGLLAMTPSSRKDFVEAMSMIDAAAVEDQVIEDTCEELATGKMNEAEAVAFVSYVCSVSKDVGKKMIEDNLMNNGYVDTSSFRELTDAELLGVPKEISEREDRTDRVEVVEVEIES